MFSKTILLNILILLNSIDVFALPSSIKIGAIFKEEHRNTHYDLAFKFAIYNINKNQHLLPKTKIIYDIKYLEADDPFKANKKACLQFENGSISMFTSDRKLSEFIKSTVKALDIPHIQTHLANYNDGNEREESFVINVFPSQNMVNKAVHDTMKFLNWTRCALIHENNEGIIMVQHILKFDPVDVLVKTDEVSYNVILEDLKEKEIYNMIVDLHDKTKMNMFLKSVLELQMNDFKYHYLFTSFDLETFEMEDFRYNFVNITAFRLVDSNDVFVKEILNNMEKFSHQFKMKFKRSLALDTKVCLIYDAVHVFALGLQTLEASSEIVISNISCKEETAFHSGSSFINFLNTVEFKGLSGHILFEEGMRSTLKLDLIKLKQNFFVKCGEWTIQSGLNITDYDSLFEGNQMNTTLVVVTILEVPYVMMYNGKNTTGNARFYGFCIDVLERISKIVGFNYILDLVHDKKYGAKDQITGEWNGMVGVLMKHKADLAVASMTINYARESVIDFSKPFMNLGISILFKVPETQETKLFSFLNPLSFDIWIFVFIAYCLVSFTVWIVARFGEWSVATKCNVNSGLYENNFSLSNSFWFVIGTLMQQGNDEMNPKATSTRVVGGIWWFFTLIIISSYTANLAAFLTVERMITPIENAEDLALQSEIAYGTLDSGSTMTFFRDSMIDTYKKMWRNMENKKNVFVSSYEEGLRRVLEGNYAFLMESTMLDYAVQRDCNLTQIGGLLDTKGYGIATAKGSIWRDKISLAILELQEKGEIQMLYDKWWKNSQETCVRDEKHKETKANSLNVENIGGVFVVLLCGLAFAVLVAIFEFCYKTKTDNFNDPLSLMSMKSSMCAELTEELCFAMSCKNANHRRHAFKKTVCHQCIYANQKLRSSQMSRENCLI